MTQGPITVLVVDDASQVRESLKEMLTLEPDFVVVGEAVDGEDAVQKARDLRPDVILMDINLPKLDGISAAEIVRKEVPCQFVMISVEKDPEYFRKAMHAGARDYLVKPFSQEELVRAIRSSLHGQAGTSANGAVPPKSQGAGKIITVFGPKGGVGKSTLAVNLGVALAKQPDTRVALVDLDLEWGAVPTLLGTRPRVTIVDLCRVQAELDLRRVEGALMHVPAYDVWVLSAPPYPHLAAEVEGEGKNQGHRNYVSEILRALESGFDWIIVDTASHFRDSNLTAFDRSNRILVVTTPEIPALENTAKCLDLLVDQLEYGPEKVQVVLNQRDRAQNLSTDEIAHGLDYPVAFEIATDTPAALMAMNTGRPITSKRSKSPLSEAFYKMAADLAGAPDGKQANPGGARGKPPRTRSKSILERVGVFNFW